MKMILDWDAWNDSWAVIESKENIEILGMALGCPFWVSWGNCQAQGQGQGQSQSQSQKSKLDPEVGSVMGWSTTTHPPTHHQATFFELKTAN